MTWGLGWGWVTPYQMLMCHVSVHPNLANDFTKKGKKKVRGGQYGDGHVTTNQKQVFSSSKN